MIAARDFKKGIVITLDGAHWFVEDYRTQKTAQRRPVLTLRIAGAAGDLTQLPHAEPKAPPTPATQSAGLQLPPLQLREFELADSQLRFRMGKAAAHLIVGHLAAHVEKYCDFLD